MVESKIFFFILKKNNKNKNKNTNKQNQNQNVDGDQLYLQNVKWRLELDFSRAFQFPISKQNWNQEFLKLPPS